MLLLPNYEIKISQDIYNRCLDFARDCNSRSYYVKNRNANVGRVLDQIIEGKIGEFATSIFFKDNWNIELEPDLNVYSTNKKSWESDLPYKKLTKNLSFENVHVKTCCSISAEKYGESWIFQVIDEIFCHDNDWVSFVLYNKEELKCWVRGICSVAFLKQNNLFKEMKLEKHRSNKCAVYYNDLIYLDKNKLKPIPTFFKKDVMESIFQSCE